MTKEDRQFISRLFQSLDQKVGSLDQKVGSLDQKVGSLDQKVGSLDQKVGSLDQKVGSLDEKIDGVESKLMAEIRHNGILIEQNQHCIQILQEGHSSLSSQFRQMREDMIDMKEKTDLIPVIYAAVQDHSRRLTALEQA